MYELIQVSDHDYYIDCPVRIGLVRVGSSEVVLIDSGNDKDAGKKVYRILESKGWNLQAILNTHSHADHIGGNHFLQEKTGCKIYAKEMECVYSNTPLLEPTGLYGGRPFKELKNKFLLAKGSRVLPLTSDVLPAGMEILDLPGHCFDMVGFRTKEGTAYIADSLSSEETLAKYGIGYLWDPKMTLETLAFVKTLDAACFVPSHAPVMTEKEELVRLADENIDGIMAIKEKILELCGVPVTFEALLKQVFDAYHLRMSAQQYALIGSTLRSYLSCLYEENKIKYHFEDNQMFWQTKTGMPKEEV